MTMLVIENPKVVRKIEESIPVIIKSGEYLIGANYALWAVKNEADKIKAIVIASNPPPNFLNRLKAYLDNVDRKIPVIKLTKSNVELGDLARKPFSISCITIYDFGNAPINENDLHI